MRLTLASLLVALPLAAPLAAETEVSLTIKDHMFAPASLEVPADQRVTLVVTNQDATAEEFESRELKVEKVIAAGKTARIVVGPLKAGAYPFAGEFHSATAKGTLVAK